MDSWDESPREWWVHLEIGSKHTTFEFTSEVFSVLHLKMEEIFSTMCLERMCYVEVVAFFFLFSPSFSTLLTPRWPVFLTHSNSFLIAGHSFSSILHTHTHALFQLLVDTPHCLYFDFFFHLILVSLSCSFFLFRAFCLRIFLFSVWSWFIIRFLSIFSWIFVKTKTQGIIES